VGEGTLVGARQGHVSGVDVVDEDIAAGASGGRDDASLGQPAEMARHGGFGCDRGDVLRPRS
jgi:hypothetical protein